MKNIKSIIGKKIIPIKRILPYVLIIIVGLLVRLWYWKYAPGVIISEDTYSYYQVGQRMLSEMFFANQYRAPLYSVFLVAVVNIMGAPFADVRSGEFFEKVFYVIPIQMLFGIAGLLIFYQTLILLKFKRTYSLLITLFIGVNIVIFSWERLLLTESIATFFVILLFYLSVKILIEPKPIHFCYYLITCVLSLMLRPFSIGLPIIPMLIAIFYHKKVKVIYFSIAVLLIYLSFVQLYSYLNYKRWGYYGVSRASDINMLGKILLYKLPIDAGKDEKFIYEKVADYTSVERDPHPFRFLEHYNLLSEDDIVKLLPLKKFSQKVIMANLPTYMLQSTKQLPGALTEVSEKVIILPWKGNLSSMIFNIDLLIARYFQFLFYLIFIFSFFQLREFIKAKTVISSAMLIALGISLYQVIFSVYIAHGEYGRLIVPAQPIMYLFSFYWLTRFLKLK